MSRDDRAPSFQFYPRDYLADRAVACMNLEQRGAYVNLLCHAWDSEDPGVLPDDDTLLAGLSGFGDRWPENRPAIARAFAMRTHSGRPVWVQKRMVAEREAQKNRYEKAAKGARATNEKKRASLAERPAERDASEPRAFTPSSASASPIESKNPAAAGLLPDTSSGAPAGDGSAERPGGGTDSLARSGESTAPPATPEARAEAVNGLARDLARTKGMPYRPPPSNSDLVDEADRQRRALADYTATREP